MTTRDEESAGEDRPSGVSSEKSSDTRPRENSKEFEKHHDADLPHWQQNIISIFAPQLLLNVPHPCPLFVVLVVAHLIFGAGMVRGRLIFRSDVFLYSP